MSESNLVQNLNHLKLLPRSWIINEFKQVISDNSGGNKKLAKSDFLDEGEIAIVDQGKELIAGYFDDISLAVKTPPPYVVFGDHTRAFKYIDFPFIMGADGTKVLQPKKDDCDTKYLYYFFLSINVPDTGYNRHFKYLKELKIPLPPLDQQKKIASILDAADAYRQKTKVLIAKYDELTQSLFLDMFGDPVTNPKGWSQQTFDKVATNKNSLRVPIKQGDRENMQGPYPYYGATGIVDYIDDFKFDGEYMLIAEDGKNLVNRKKPIAWIAKGQFWVNNHSHVVEYNGLANLTFLSYQLNGTDISQYVTGIDQFKMNKNNLNRIPVPIPPTDLQEKFAERVQAIEAQKTQAQESLDKAKELFNSLLQKAFKGELT